MKISMKKNKVYITWEQIFERLVLIDKIHNAVYGVPKGGMIAAGFLTEATKVTSPERANIILDDLIDSGKTAEYYKTKFPTKSFYTLFDKHTKDKDLRESWLVFPWEAQHPAGEDTIEDNILRQLQYIGEDVTRDGLLDTPKRVVKSWKELFSGYGKDPKDVFKKFDPDGYDEIVLLKNFEIYSMCEHHMLPFFGKAHVAYIPEAKEGKIIGISKLARLTDIFARRLQIQERIGKQVVEELNKNLNPKGAACIIEASHMCMRMRGVNKQNSIMITSTVTGAFREDPSARAELMQLIQMRI